jgi:hypothetical protein
MKTVPGVSIPVPSPGKEDPSQKPASVAPPRALRPSINSRENQPRVGPYILGKTLGVGATG